MITDRIEIVCKNTATRYYVAPGNTLLSLVESLEIALPHPILGVMVNNRLRDLRIRVFMPVTVEFIDITHPAGMRMYVRSLFFLLQKAVRDGMPSCRLRVNHSVSRG